MLTFGVSSLVGLVFGLLPAARAARLDPLAPRGSINRHLADRPPDSGAA